MKRQFTKAGPQDLEALRVLINSAYRATEGIIGWTYEGHLLQGERTSIAHLEEILQAPQQALMKCEGENGQLLGCVHLEKQGNLLYLGMLSVDPRVQNTGIGKFILQASRQYALNEECEKIKITVISVRKELIEWYVRNGFQKTDEHLEFLPDERFGKLKQPLELLVMEWAF